MQNIETTDHPQTLKKEIDKFTVPKFGNFSQCTACPLALFCLVGEIDAVLQWKCNVCGEVGSIEYDLIESRGNFGFAKRFMERYVRYILWSWPSKGWRGEEVPRAMYEHREDVPEFGCVKTLEFHFKDACPRCKERKGKT